MNHKVGHGDQYIGLCVFSVGSLYGVMISE